MPLLTDRQIDAASDAEALARLLIDAGKELPLRLRERILAFGPPVIPPLVAMIEDDELSLETAPGEGWAPIHAVDLLADLKAVEAIDPMLRLLADSDWMSILHDRVIQGLPRIGPPVLEPALAAHATTTDDDLRRSLTGVLAALKVRDDRVYEVLTEALQENVEFGAMSLAEYGDPRALPLLSAALDQFEVDISDSFMANHTAIELEGAIEELGGELTPAQRETMVRVRALHRIYQRKFSALLDRAVGRGEPESLPDTGAHPLRSEPRPPRAARKVGRNDLCPCGSGKKYKKCCLGKG